MTTGWLLHPRIRTAFLDPNTSGDNLLVAPVLGAKFRVIAYRLQGSGTVSLKFTDTGGATLSQTWDFQAREGCIVSSVPLSFEFQTTGPNLGLNINLSANVQAHVMVQYVEVSPEF